MTDIDTDWPSVTATCPGCGKTTHLWEDESGSGWMHDTAADDYRCFRDNRAMYEAGDL
jgi:hypothetical protein